MANLLTPLTKTPVVDWHDTVVGPDVPQSMLNALGSLERYTNVPVADAPTRETVMPTAQRYIGQVTYNVATDTFEYWDGTRWRPVNQKASFPSTLNIASQVNITLAPNQYYDYRATVVITTPCIATIWAKVVCRAAVAPTTWQGVFMQLVCDDSVWGGMGESDVFYPANPGNGVMDLTTFGRYILANGTHTLGLRVVANAGSVPLQVNMCDVMIMRTAYTPNPNAGVNAYGDW